MYYRSGVLGPRDSEQLGGRPVREELGAPCSNTGVSSGLGIYLFGGVHLAVLMHYSCQAWKTMWDAED